MRAMKVEPLNDQAKLGRFNRIRIQPPVRREGRLEAAFLEALRPAREAVAIPIHDSHSVAPLREKYEEVALEWIVTEYITDDHH